MEDRSVEPKISLLIDILNHEIELLENIKAVEVDKNFLLTTKRKNIDLTPQNDLLERYIKEEAILERSREGLLEELGNHFQGDHLTLKELINKISSEKKKELTAIHNRMQQLLLDIKEVNGINKIILNDLIKLVGYALDLYSQDRELETDYTQRNAQSNKCKSLVLNTVI